MFNIAHGRFQNQTNEIKMSVGCSVTHPVRAFCGTILPVGNKSRMGMCGLWPMYVLNLDFNFIFLSGWSVRAGLSS